MTLCIAAACQDRKRPRIVIASDWKAGIEIATAEIQEKLFWINSNVPVLVAGTVSRALELKQTYSEYFEFLRNRKPPVELKRHNIFSLVKRPVAIFKHKLANEYVSLKLGLDYKTFRVAVGKNEVPASIAAETFGEIAKIELECSMIMMFFLEKETYIFQIERDGSVESCDNFAAIGTGSPIAQGVLYQRMHEARDPLGPSIYHVFEAMKLGSIASDVGEEHTFNVLYPQGERGKDVTADWLPEKATRFLERQFRKFGPKNFARLQLPKRGFFKKNF